MRRGRLAALTLAAVAALTMTTLALAAQGDPGQAHLQASKHRVRYGDRMRLKGGFPGAPNARVEIRQRTAGAKHWPVVKHTRTGPQGGFSKRLRPRATGHWRAQLADPQSAGDAGSVDGDPLGDPAAAPVDSRTASVQVRVRSRTKPSVSGRNSIVGHSVRVSGRVLPAGERRRVVIHAGGQQMATTARRDGHFSESWHPRSTGSYRVKVKARRNRLASGSGDRAGKVDVFRPAAASWYGPGFYGHRTACGQTLTTSTVGVANKTLPCGSKLTLRYHGREVRVPVIDRGPYSPNREFDLTQATKNRLGFGSTGTVLSSK